MENNFQNIDIQTLIPQQPPFVMVEKLIFCSVEKTTTSFTIKNDNIFVENGIFTQSGIVENVAQTCAARMGYLGDNQTIKIGMIGSINNFEFTGFLPKINDKIITDIVVDTEIGNIVLLDTKVVCNKKTVSTGKMKVFLTDFST
ncbi:MAG: pseudouridylate synthase [Paludibacter sp.]|nr:pseudouridylate synthase [Paludibacter sp.]